MMKSRSFNQTFAFDSSMNESACAASSSFVGLILDTVIAVSIFVILALISSVVVLADVSVIILAILSVVIIAVAVLLAELIIELSYPKRPNEVKA